LSVRNCQIEEVDKADIDEDLQALLSFEQNENDEMDEII